MIAAMNFNTMIIKEWIMQKLVIPLTALMLISGLIPFHLHAQEKLAQSGFQFLSVGTAAKASAMAEAYTTSSGFSDALLYNPAGLGKVSAYLDLSGSWNRWIADISYQSATLSLRPKDGQYGVFGLSFLWVDYGEFLGTMVWNNEKGYIDTENFSPKAMAVGLGYGRMLTDKFSVGGQIKYVIQTPGESVVPGESAGSGLEVKKYVLSVMAFDFGTLYFTGFKSLVFGMSVRNFSQEVKYEQEGFQLPLTFRIGIAMNLIDFFEHYGDKHALLFAIDAVHPRALNEFVSIGIDYTLLDAFSIRCGYTSGQSEYGFTYGLGIRQFGISFDYAFIPFGVFNDVQKISIGYTF